MSEVLVEGRFRVSDRAQCLEVGLILLEVALVVPAEPVGQVLGAAMRFRVGKMPLGVEEVDFNERADDLGSTGGPGPEVEGLVGGVRHQVGIALPGIEDVVLDLVLGHQSLSQIVSKVLGPGFVAGVWFVLGQFCSLLSLVVVGHQRGGIPRRVDHPHAHRLPVPVKSWQQVDHAVHIVVVNVEPEIEIDLGQVGLGVTSDGVETVECVPAVSREVVDLELRLGFQEALEHMRCRGFSAIVRPYEDGRLFVEVYSNVLETAEVLNSKRPDVHGLCICLVPAELGLLRFNGEG